MYPELFQSINPEAIATLWPLLCLVGTAVLGTGVLALRAHLHNNDTSHSHPIHSRSLDEITVQDAEVYGKTSASQMSNHGFTVDGDRHVITYNHPAEQKK